MKVGFLLHLYQPITQNQAEFALIFNSCYAPLLKFIKSQKNFRLTLNIPLSLLEQLDKYGYVSWISELKDLVDSERVSLTGCAAYHALLTKIPPRFVEEQVQLNEYGLAYYLGRHTGFEGESSLLIKDLNGFFPPELAINEKVASSIKELGYQWILADECAISENVEHRAGIYDYGDGDASFKVVIRDRDLSNLISFKRDDDISDVVSAIKDISKKKNYCIIALDGEAFGHHYKDGLLMLGNLISYLSQIGFDFATVDEIITETSKCKGKLDVVRESCWGASDYDITQGTIYPFWQDLSNDTHNLQWDIVRQIFTQFENTSLIDFSTGYETLPIWNSAAVEHIGNPKVKQYVMVEVLLHKCMHSDQFWWASRKKLPIGVYLYNKDMITKAFDLFVQLANVSNNSNLLNYLIQKKEDLLKLLEK